MDTRFKDNEWRLNDSNGNIGTWERVQVAVLMDIRDQLNTLNRVFACHNFQDIPFGLQRSREALEKIVKNTAKPKRKKPK